MILPRKRCLMCSQWFVPRPQTPRQAICSQVVCQKVRHRKACIVWNKKHPDHDHSRRGKIRAWAKAYVDYWQQYRRTHPDYAARERARRRGGARRSR